MYAKKIVTSVVVVLKLYTAPPTPPKATPNRQPRFPRYYKSKLKASKPGAQKNCNAQMIAISVVVVLTAPPKPPPTAMYKIL